MQKLVVVTGGAGFVGSHLCQRLAADGYQVISLDNYFTGSIDNHVPGVEYRTGHTKDIHTHISEQPAMVYHLGEYARTEKSFEDIETVWDLNKTGTFSVLEFCRERKCKLIYAGSSTKFADNGQGRDQSPYAWSKATNTELVKNYGEWFGLEYVITYFYNVYGPREMAGPFGTLIRIFSELYRQGQPLTVVSPGDQTRNFTHVSDIIAGLVLAGEKGMGDGYGIGADESFTVLEVAKLFGSEILLLPPRAGNRLTAGVDNLQVKALGWQQQHKLPQWIESVKKTIGVTVSKPVRILVFSTTFSPNVGVSEQALCELLGALPSIHFDIITSAYIPGTMRDECVFPNATVHRVGNGTYFDKYFLPFLGQRVARKLLETNDYEFKWSLLASYGALAAIFSNTKKLPLLVTIADQKVTGVSWYVTFLLKFILHRADQVHVIDTTSAHQATNLAQRTKLLASIGDGDALSNQIRVTYTGFLRNLL